MDWNALSNGKPLGLMRVGVPQYPLATMYLFTRYGVLHGADSVPDNHP